MSKEFNGESKFTQDKEEDRIIEGAEAREQSRGADEMRQQKIERLRQDMKEIYRQVADLEQQSREADPRAVLAWFKSLNPQSQDGLNIKRRIDTQSDFIVEYMNYLSAEMRHQHELEDLQKK